MISRIFRLTILISFAVSCSQVSYGSLTEETTRESQEIKLTRLTYFTLGLDCPIPVVESLHYNSPESNCRRLFYSCQMEKLRNGLSSAVTYELTSHVILTTDFRSFFHQGGKNAGHVMICLAFYPISDMPFPNWLIPNSQVTGSFAMFWKWGDSHPLGIYDYNIAPVVSETGQNDLLSLWDSLETVPGAGQDGPKLFESLPPNVLNEVSQLSFF